MNLYLISQDENNWYDTYDSAVVCAEMEEQARMIHPKKKEWDGVEDNWKWCAAKHVKAQLIGEAVPEMESGTVVCASYNAG